MNDRITKNIGVQSIYDAAMSMYEKEDDSRNFKDWIEDKTEFKKNLELISLKYARLTCVWNRRKCRSLTEDLFTTIIKPYCEKDKEGNERMRKIHWLEFKDEFRCGEGVTASYLCADLHKNFKDANLV